MTYFKALFIPAFLLLILIIPNSSLSQELHGFRQDRVDEQLKLEQQLIQHNSPQQFRTHLFNLTQHPHIAGTENSRKVIEYISRVMDDAGLTVTHYDYDAWMPQPGTASVSVIRPVRIPLNNQEYIYDEDPYSSHPDLLHGWNAYSGSGDVTGEVVYANYGRKEDFELLKELGVNLTDKIVIARYGGNFRGFKALFAEQVGAAGLILYTDPANGGYMNGFVYPEGRFNDESAIQRGSLLTLDYFGDPLTPFEPALPLDGEQQVERLDPSEVPFHTIPVAPIGYGAANEILSRMRGSRAVPAGWQGGLPYTYRLEGGSELLVNVNVDQPHGFTRITNVVGTLKGELFPDEWIILGSHHDAWGFGATDPNSGTAMLLTLSESLGELYREGWRPARSIKIAHWDAEEFLLIGSTEWVEQFRDELHEKAVLYLNADMSVTGPLFRASASPSLKRPIIEASREVTHPDRGDALYDGWIREGQSEPAVGNLGGGSDHVGFYMHAGIPSAGISMSGSVPIYHTNFDSFHFYETFVDSTFSYGPALAGVYGVVATRFANSDILPYDLSRYPRDISGHLDQLMARAAEFGRGDTSDLTKIHELLSLTETIAVNTEGSFLQLLATDPDQSKLREINEKLIRLERSFLHPEGLPYSRWQQSLYTATDPWSGYATWMIPGARYILEIEGEEKDFHRELERFTQSVETLTDTLQELLRAAEGSDAE